MGGLNGIVNWSLSGIMFLTQAIWLRHMIAKDLLSRKGCDSYIPDMYLQ